MQYTNIITIKEIILLKKVKEERKLSENIIDITMPLKVA